MKATLRRLTARPALLVSVFTCCWAVVELIGPATGVSAYQVVWTRYGVHLLLLTLLFGRSRGVSLVRTSQPVTEIICSLLMLGMPLCFIWALSRMSMSDALAVFWTAPLMIITITAVMGGEYGGMRTIFACVAGLIGAVLICRPDFGVLRPAALLALGMAACFAFYVVGMGSLRGDPILVKLFHTGLWVFAALTLVQPFVWHTPSTRGLVAMIAIGALGWVGLYALDQAIEAASPALIAPVFYTQLAWETLLESREQLMHQPRALAGIIIVLAAASAGIAWVDREAPVSASPAEALSPHTNA